MNLYQKLYSARTSKWGTQQFNLVAGDVLKIETSPGGSEVLDEEVPAGKKWVVICNVDITEEDA